MDFSHAAAHVGGDGLSTRVNAPNTNNVYQLTVEQRTEGFEMPSLLNIGFAYDLELVKDHELSIAGNFTSNSWVRCFWSIHKPSRDDLVALYGFSSHKGHEHKFTRVFLTHALVEGKKTDDRGGFIG